jgi:hypothetical protein
LSTDDQGMARRSSIAGGSGASPAPSSARTSRSTVGGKCAANPAAIIACSAIARRSGFGAAWGTDGGMRTILHRGRPFTIGNRPFDALSGSVLSPLPTLFPTPIV